MLSCRACFRRYVHALDIPAIHLLQSRTHLNPLSQPSGARLRSSRHDPLKNAARRADASRSSSDPWKESEVAANQKKREKSALRQSRRHDSRPVTPNFAKLGQRDPRMSEQDWNRRKRELRYLQDPLELAIFVANELRKDKVEEMLQLVVMASHSMECVVSWNHIINYYLGKSKINNALKVYNDMKKRAQFPDAYTYTILLRGLSENAHLSGVLSKALSIYHSLSAPNSRVEPSIIHTNAALRVCARALDMDALWGIAGKIPEKGPAAANARTYLTIMNAIRQSLLLNGPKGETADQATARKDREITEARRMWEGITSRWRRAEITIDEELVCAMGRLLLVGSRPRDWDDVLSLVEQTMDIPRFVPRLGTEERQLAGIPRLRAPNVPTHQRFDDDHLSPDNKGMRGDEFLPLRSKGVESIVSEPLSYVQPSVITLSLIQEACLKTVACKASQQYWDLLTDPGVYNVVPDIACYNMRLRNIRQARASSQAVKLLLEMVDQDIPPRTGSYRIAMSACVRDKNNHNSFRHAGQILDMMSKYQEDVDSKTVFMFAELAVGFPLATGPDLVEALTRLNAMAKNIRLQLSVGGERQGHGGVGAVYLRGEERQDAIKTLAKIHGVYDRLVFSNLIEEGEKSPFKQERARLSAFITRIVHKDRGQEPTSKGKPDEATSNDDMKARSTAKMDRPARRAGNYVRPNKPLRWVMKKQADRAIAQQQST